MISYAENASSLQKAFGEMLILCGLGDLEIAQEVQVKSICPDHHNKRDRFDYYIRELNLVIELHGQQHYKAVTFGGIDKINARDNFVQQVISDDRKRLSALRAGILYIHFDHNEEITPANFFSKLESARNSFKADEEEALRVSVRTKPPRKKRDVPPEIRDSLEAKKRELQLELSRKRKELRALQKAQRQTRKDNNDV